MVQTLAWHGAPCDIGIPRHLPRVAEIGRLHLGEMSATCRCARERRQTGGQTDGVQAHREPLDPRLPARPLAGGGEGGRFRVDARVSTREIRLHTAHELSSTRTQGVHRPRASSGYPENREFWCRHVTGRRIRPQIRLAVQERSLIGVPVASRDEITREDASDTSELAAARRTAARLYTSANILARPAVARRSITRGDREG